MNKKIARATPGQRRNKDGDGAYAKALATARRKGAVDLNDAELMAGLLDDTLQILAGPGYSARLVWEGAQRRGLTARQVLTLAENRDHTALDDLMFGE